MKKVYINGLGCISCQKTFDSVFLEEAEIERNLNVLTAIEPVYKDYISPGASRRMAKGVKNGIVASAMAMKDANVSNLDAIITGTGLGCIEDSEKFLKSIIDNQEEFLTPTSFIQSTHNTVGGQIALGLQCKAYNFTYVNGGISFESALLDAKLQLELDESETILVGGIDESADFTTQFFKIATVIKGDVEKNISILDSKTTGHIAGEGASFFVLENKKTDNSYAEIASISVVNTLEPNHVENQIKDFLKENSLNVDEIDAVILGINGDINFNNYYKNISENLFKNTPQVYYKHLSGDYHTASSFGFYVGSKILKLQEIPEIIRLNSMERTSFKTILLYNQYLGKDHSFILLKQC